MLFKLSFWNVEIFVWRFEFYCCCCSNQAITIAFQNKLNVTLKMNKNTWNILRVLKNRLALYLYHSVNIFIFVYLMHLIWFCRPQSAEEWEFLKFSLYVFQEVWIFSSIHSKMLTIYQWINLFEYANEIDCILFRFHSTQNYLLKRILKVDKISKPK